MPPKARKQPPRQNRTGGGMEELLAGVLDELKTLKEQVKAVSEAQQVAVPAGGAPVKNCPSARK